MKLLVEVHKNKCYRVVFVGFHMVAALADLRGSIHHIIDGHRPSSSLTDGGLPRHLGQPLNIERLAPMM